MTRDATTAFARTLVDEWVRAGVTDAVIAPGSRSAPLALAIADDGRLTVHVILDERAAGFLALGLGRATGRPAVVVTTSGTAPANLHPAILEAHHGLVPMIVCTADRPPELRGVGAPQTIDQVHLFGTAVRVFVDAEPPRDAPGAGEQWRALGATSVCAAAGPPAGPAHLNLPFREPLVPTGAPLVEAPGRADEAPWLARPDPTTATTVDAALVDDLVDRVHATDRGLVIAGWGSGARPATVRRFLGGSGYGLIADPLSGLAAMPEAVPAYDAIIRAGALAESHRPRTVVRLGAPPTSKATNTWIGECPDVVVIAAPGLHPDPDGIASRVVAADPDALLAAVADRLESEGTGSTDQGFAAAWSGASARVVEALDRTMDAWSEFSEPRVARDVVAALPPGTALLVASSMPVRDVESFARPAGDATIHANRGVNGIDGFVSTALGISRGHTGATVALGGDLSFLHDGGGQLATRPDDDIVVVVIDNGGGGIFSFLPQADLDRHFEMLFGTPPAADIAAVATAHGFTVLEVVAPADLGPAIGAAIGRPGPQLVLVRTDRARNVEHHRELWHAAATALTPQ